MLAELKRWAKELPEALCSLLDIKAAVDAGANAVAAGAFFVFHGPHRAVLITYPDYNELEDLLST